MKENKTDDLTDALATLSPEIAEVIQRAKAKADIQSDARDVAGEIHTEVEQALGEPVQTWLPMCPMPTDLCRVSPFFPMARKDLGRREYLRDITVTETSWGSIRYSGPQLSTYDEDCLIGILALLNQANERTVTEIEGERTYTYKGPLLPVLKLMGLSRGAVNYQRVKESLKLMHSAVLEMQTYKRNSRGKRKVSQWSLTNLLSTAHWNEEKKELTVTVNPYFYEIYNQGNVTLLDVVERSRLKSPIAKSLHRFIKSHRDPKWSGHFLTLSATLNIDVTQPHIAIRRYLKRAITELISVGILTGESGLKRDIVTVVLNQPPRKAPSRARLQRRS